MIQPDAAPSFRKLDALDLRLLHELRRNARTSAEELSRVLALSRPAVRDRMRRLERMGVLVGYTIVVEWESLGYPILAFIWVRTGSGDCAEHARAVMALSNDAAFVDECHRVTGEWCLLVKVHARSSRDLADLLDAIRQSPHVIATATTLALSTDRRTELTLA